MLAAIHSKQISRYEINTDDYKARKPNKIMQSSVSSYMENLSQCWGQSVNVQPVEHIVKSKNVCKNLDRLT